MTKLGTLSVPCSLLSVPYLHESINPMANATPYGYRGEPPVPLRFRPLGVRFAHTPDA
ncbi:MAG: hypothetical protein KME46_14720 [Brasilonema angustatum HA4187-MV1]|nr:hypothetical protein [Brasilonema angustatum HA4187-MV1]